MMRFYDRKIIFVYGFEVDKFTVGKHKAEYFCHALYQWYFENQINDAFMCVGIQFSAINLPFDNLYCCPFDETLRINDIKSPSSI